MINPIAAGIVSNVTSRIACARAERKAAMSPSAAVRETSGKVTVPTATPKIPSGNCINRKAMFNQLTGPSPSRAAKPLLISTFTWTALAAITAGPISIRTVRTP